MNKIEKLLNQKKALEIQIKIQQKRDHEKQRERIFSLAAQAGIADLPDEVLRAAFFRIAETQKQQKTEVSDE